MTTYDYDLFVIGAGSGGVRAARIAAGHGARVGIAEEYRYGGTCVVRGCIPKKLFVYGSHYHHDFEDAAAYGWTIEGADFDWATLIANKDKEIDRLTGIYAGLLAEAQVKLHDGRATLADAHTIEVNGERFTAGVILVATGGRPWKPDGPGAEYAICSNEAFHLPELPRRVALIGGGYIGVEFAGIFSGYGSEVTLAYRRDKILRGFDYDVRTAVQTNLIERGVDVRLNTTADSIQKTDDGLRLSLSDGAVLDVDVVMCATGRVPNSGGLGLETIGVELGGRGAIVVDEYSRTTVPHIYAVGDVTDRMALTPVALHEGHAFADSVFGDAPRPVDHEYVPAAVFGQPPASVVGMTEAEARTAYEKVDIYRSTFTPLKHTLTKRKVKTMMKLVVDADSQRVVGCHIVGDDAPEIVQAMAIAMKMGATKADLDRTIGIHPTAAEELVTMRHKIGR
jgi:glutathione reductase (NADPH)